MALPGRGGRVLPRRRLPVATAGEGALGAALIVAASFNLRPAVAAVPAVMESIRRDAGLSAAQASLLTALPTLAMGLFAGLALPLVRRFGVAATMALALLAVGLAGAARLGSAWSPVLLGSSAVLGAAIAVASAVGASAVKRHGSASARVSALSTAAVIVGATVAAGTTAPLARLTGSWPAALSLWSVPALAAAGLWWRAARRGDRGPAATDRASAPSLLPRAPAAHSALMAVLFAAQSFAFYAVLTWLPARYEALGWSTGAAGSVLATFLAGQLLGVALPRVAGESIRRVRRMLAGTFAVTTASLLALALAPEVAAHLVAAALGAGSGGAFALGLLLPVLTAVDATDAARLSARVQLVGYSAGAGGPVAVGALLDAGAGFGAAVMVLAAVTAVGAVLSRALR